MKLKNINAVAQNKGFKVFDDAELVLAINAKAAPDTPESNWTN